MLTGDETVTSGNAFVGGFSILTNLSQARQNLGSTLNNSNLFSYLILFHLFRLLSARRRSFAAFNWRGTLATFRSTSRRSATLHREGWLEILNFILPTHYILS